MANELVIHYPTGATLYVLLSDATGQVYNGSTFEAPGSASWATYGIAMTEAATATGIYRASMPAVAAGVYGWTVRKQAGGSPAVSDATVGVGEIRWTGTAEETVPASANVTMWKGEDAGSAPLKPTVSGRTLDVSATGEAGLDFDNRKDTNGILPSGMAGSLGGLPVLDGNSLLPANVVRWDSNNMSGTLPALQGADGDTLETLSDQLDATATAAALATVDAIVDAILEDTGTTLPEMFAASGATVTVVSAVSGGDITVYANDTWEFTVSSDSISLSGYEALALVVKRTASQDDSDALLYLRSDSGLQRIDGAAPDSAANGTLASTATSFTGTVAISETAGVTARSNYVWWLKGFDTTPTPDEGFTLATGKFTIMPAGLQAIA